MTSMTFHFSIDSRNLSEGELEALFEESMNGPCIVTRDGCDECPMAWDAGFSIEQNRDKTGNDLVICGSVDGHGYGVCRIAVPLDNRVPYCFELQFTDASVAARWAARLKHHGYVLAEQSK